MEGEGHEASEGEIKTKKRLTYQDLMLAQNIVDLIDEDELGKIGALVTSEYEIDKSSRHDWETRYKAGIDLAMMVSEEKNYPFANAANVKYPLIATAALQFNARAYPAICPPDRVVKAKTNGADPDGQKSKRADRISEYMSWQCMEQMPEWEEDTDKLTLIVPIVGCSFRKVFYDPSLRRKVSRLVTADRLVYHYKARSFEDLPRLTELLSLYPYEIAERIRDKRFADFDYDELGSGEEDGTTDGGDPQTPHLFLEQHRLLDLDGDGYPEPYIVTVHKSSGKVCRIIANWSADTAQVEADEQTGEIKVTAIRKQAFFIRYLFLPSPDGGAYGLGFGWLLSDMNDAINGTLNLTFDAAKLSNMQGGFISANLGPKVKNQTFRFEQGEWKIINASGPLNQAMMPLNYPGPSAVLFSLLEFLVNSGKELASIKDVLTGETPATAPVGTTMALIEQGLQVFTSIYKRIYVSLKKEFKLHAQLNKKHVTVEEYAEFFDEEGVDPQQDFNLKDMNVLPVSDPQSVTKAQRIAKAQAVYGLSLDNPTMDRGFATREMLEAIGAENIDKLVPPPPPPDPEQMALAKRAAVADIAEKEAATEDKIASATSKLAAAIKAIADAEGVEVGNQMAYYGQIVNMLKTEHSMENDIVGQANAGQGGVPGMEGPPGNAGSPPPPDAAGNGLGLAPAGAAAGPAVPAPIGPEVDAPESSAGQGIL